MALLAAAVVLYSVVDDDIHFEVVVLDCLSSVLVSFRTTMMTS